MMKILNLTQHPATAEQKEAGVYDLEDTSYLKGLLTFNEIPHGTDMAFRAGAIAGIAVREGVSMAMIGGAPYFMSPLEKALQEHGIKPVYAFSKRVVEEVTLPDGTVEKKSKFVFEGFVE